jgi:hypothetical protein
MISGTVAYTLTDDHLQQRRELITTYLIPNGAKVNLMIGDVQHADLWVIDELRKLDQRAVIEIQGTPGAIWWWLGVLRGEEVA